MRTLANSVIRRTICLLLAGAGVVGAALAQESASPTVQWMEAEDYVAQLGSTAPKFSMDTASGGACVDNDWGGKEGHFLRYRVAPPAGFTNLYVTLRYARETAGDSVVRMMFDNQTNQSVVLRLPSTGDWGFKSEGWQYATAQLPAGDRGSHTLEIRSQADRNNVNFDGFYVSAQPLDTSRAFSEPPSGPEAIAPLGEGMVPLPCQTPIALPYSRLKASVAGSGLIRGLLSTPEPRGMGGNILGPSLHVKLAGQGPWIVAEQTLLNSPVPTVVTRLKWADVELEQAVFAAAPEERGFFIRVTLTNKTAQLRVFELASLIGGAVNPQAASADRITAQGKPLLRVLPSAAVTTTAAHSAMPGPLGGARLLRHTAPVAGGATASFDLQFLGNDLPREEAFLAAEQFWREKLAAAARIQLPDTKLQYAFDASLRQMLMLIEPRPDHARILKGLQHYYGANPYDTLQVSRALDAVGLRADAEELLRHQIAHLKHDGIFEMWETGDLDKRGAEQWIVQGLAAVALWGHYELWGEEAWLREITPTLIKAAQTTLQIRRQHLGAHKQGNVEVEGWLPPLGGDGGLGVGYHWSQNAGPLAGVRIAAEAARRLNLPEAEALRAGYLDFQRAVDRVRQQSVQVAGMEMIPAFPGAERDGRTRPLWGVVMSVSTFEVVPYNDPPALGTLRFLQRHQHGGLHLNLGYSRGVWPYLSAEVAQWHLRLEEGGEAWRLLRAIVDRASTTVCWHEEIDLHPARGCGDAADVWAAAETVFLTRQLLAWQNGDELRICSGLPDRYLRAGQTISAKAVPTSWGACAFDLHFESDSASAEIQFASGNLPSRLRVCLAPVDGGGWKTVRVDGADNPKWEGRDLILAAPKRNIRIIAR